MSDDGLDSAPQALAGVVPERDVLEAVRDRDRKAVARFVDLHADAVYAYVHRRLDRPSAVDDLVQEVFLAAWSALPRFRGESEIRTWLLGIARHKVGDYYRERLREIPLSDELEEETAPTSSTPAPGGEEDLDRQRREARTRRILATLPDRYRAVLFWRYWDQRSVAEMAAITGHTEKSIERLLDRARRLFRRKWSDE